MNIYYCDNCGVKISEVDESLFHTAGGRVVCAKCKRDLSGSSEVTGAAKRRSPSAGFAKTHSSPVNRAAQAVPSKSSPLPVILALAGVAVIAILGLYLNSNSKPAETPLQGSPTVAPVSQKPAPPPVQVEPHPEIAPADLEKQADLDLDALQKKTLTPVQKIDALNDFLKKYNDTIPGGKARRELRKLTLQQELASATKISIKTAEESKTEIWSFYRGDEFPGATGKIERDDKGAMPGKSFLKLTGDFAKGGAYVAAILPLASQREMLSVVDFKRVINLTIWVRSTQLREIGLRLEDSTGQIHQQHRGFTPNGEWQAIVVDSLNAGPGRDKWGGANDGIFHWPMVGIHILIGKTFLVPLVPGNLWIDRIEFTIAKENK